MIGYFENCWLVMIVDWFKIEITCYAALTEYDWCGDDYQKYTMYKIIKLKKQVLH